VDITTLDTAGISYGIAAEDGSQATAAAAAGVAVAVG